MAYFRDDDDSYNEDNYSDDFSSDEGDDYMQQEIEAMAGRCDGSGGEKKEDEIKCECKQCRETELGKHSRYNPNEYV